MFHVEHTILMNTKQFFLKVKDYSVSGEIFRLDYDLELDMLETIPQPSIDNISQYYKSEDYISHTDSKRNLFERVYHLVRAYSINQKIKLINKHSTETKELLDIGCGTGDFLLAAKNSGWIITGIEPDLRARTIANQKTGNRVHDKVVLEKLSESTFDVVTLWHVLEHLPDLDKQIKIISSLLKPCGTMIVAVPNFKSYDAKYYKQFWAAFDVPRHLWHFSKKSISLLFSKEELKLVETKPMKFDSYYVSLLSEKYKSGKMRIFKAFYRGWLSNNKAKGSGEYSSLIYVLKKHQK